MKFKLIFIIFNAIVLFSFLFIALLPIFMLGWDYAAPFWQRSWYLLLLFLVILGGLDWYFIRNWKFFSLLETQNWDDIRDYLETRVFEEKKVGEQAVQILLTVYVQSNRPDEIQRLGELVREIRPRLHTKQLLNFSLAYLLREDYNGLGEFLAPAVNENRISLGGWIDWYWAFARLRSGFQEEGIAVLRRIAEQSRDDLLLVLSLYMLISVVGDSQSAEKHRGQIAAVKKKYSPALWAKKIDSRKDRLYILTLSAVLQQAGDWLIKDYEGQSTAVASAEPMEESP